MPVRPPVGVWEPVSVVRNLGSPEVDVTARWVARVDNVFEILSSDAEDEMEDDDFDGDDDREP